MKIDYVNTITTDNAGERLGKIKNKFAKKIKYDEKDLTVDDILKQYNPNQHAIFDKTKRQDRIIEVPVPGDTSVPRRMMPKPVVLNRVGIPMQKLIVSRATAFLTGNGMKIDCEPANPKEETLLEAIKRVNDNNKMDYKNTTIANIMHSETECAELWYIIDDTGADTDDYEGIAITTRGLTLRCKIIARSLGDELYPIWDETGAMIAFIRVWYETNDENQKITHNEIYTASKTVFIDETDGKGQYTRNEKDNLVGKIPIIYYSQAQPEWLDVQSCIERLETLLSNNGDSNDYYSSPTTVVSGEIEGFSQKGETGKVLEVGKDASVTLLEAKNGVESIKFEKETLKEIIFEGTQTPDISFESMKGLGTFSGIALKMLFFDASLKVSSKLPTYGESKQRSLNFIKAALAKFDLSFKVASLMIVKPKIEPYMPQNTQELSDMLIAQAGQKPIISQDTAVANNPLVKDAKAEMIKINAAAEKEFGQQGVI